MKCDTCPIRTACNECDKELSCEEFKKYKALSEGNNHTQDIALHFTDTTYSSDRDLVF